MNDYHPVNNKRHENTKLKKIRTYSHVSSLNNVSLLMQEFIQAANEFPIIFIKHPELGLFHSVAVTGLELGENMFVKDDDWTANFIPGSVALYPFKAGKIRSTENEMYTSFLVDENCSQVNTSDGIPLFDNSGKETSLLATYRLSVTKYFEDNIETNKFVNYLLDNELFEECVFSYESDNNQYEINGIYKIDENKLKNLSDEEILMLNKKGYLSLIYAHLSSFYQFDLMAKRKTSNI